MYSHFMCTCRALFLSNRRDDGRVYAHDVYKMIEMVSEPTVQDTHAYRLVYKHTYVLET